MTTATTTFEATEAFARGLDEADALAPFRERFHVPVGSNGEPVVYFCGNSLGLMPRAAAEMVREELDDWATLAVAGHTRARRPWFSYHELFSESLARLVGARPGEAVCMNALTVNIHLMLATFYRPAGKRTRILIERPAFPSDLYAVRTHVRARGLDPEADVVQVRPRDGEHAVRTEDVESLLAEQGDRIALVWLPGVNYYTGQVFDMAAITAAARAAGCRVGFDLAHAVGNVPMRLHDWDVDFACWCSYKYLNGGPGAAGGCFVHERHGSDLDLPRLAGWWGDDPATRFQMHLKDRFIPQPGAAGWQVSNPPILSMTPLRAALDIFDEAGMDPLRDKSLKLTGFLRHLIEQDRFEVITPAAPAGRGCQLSIRVRDRNPRAAYEALLARDVVCDFREPDVIRVAPVPLYNSFREVWRFAEVLNGL